MVHLSALVIESFKVLGHFTPNLLLVQLRKLQDNNLKDLSYNKMYNIWNELEKFGISSLPLTINPSRSLELILLILLITFLKNIQKNFTSRNLFLELIKIFLLHSKQISLFLLTKDYLRCPRFILLTSLINLLSIFIETERLKTLSMFLFFYLNDLAFQRGKIRRCLWAISISSNCLQYLLQNFRKASS